MSEQPYTHAFVVGRVHYLPALDLTYLNNAKVACATIKRSMWMAADERLGTSTYNKTPNDRRGGPFSKSLRDLIGDRQEEFLASAFFSVVRNPYARALSGYLDKIMDPVHPGTTEPRDRGTWPKIVSRYGLAADARLSFLDFFQMVAADDPIEVDWHFCRQSTNLLQPLCPLDYVGHMERMDEVEAFLAGYSTPLREYTKHRTGADTRISEFYQPREIALVRDYYADDFEAFGYSDDPAILQPQRPVKASTDRAGLERFLTGALPKPLAKRESAPQLQP